MMARYFVHDGGTAREIDLNELCAPDERHPFIWVHLDGSSDDVDGIVSRLADMPETAITALKASETRPRYAQFGNGALVNLRGQGTPLLAEGDPLVSIRLWAQQRLIVSLTYRPLNALERLCGQMLAGEVKDPGDLIAALAIDITDELDPDIADLGDALDAIESRIADRGLIGERRKVAELRAKAISYRRFLAPQRQAMDRLMATQADWLEPEDRLHIQEAADRCARMVEELEAVRERAALAHEELTDLRAEHMNKQALVLAIVALIFLPLTFVTGLLGMNVAGIPFAHEPWAFWGVVLFCLAVGAVVSFWFKVTHWLQK